MRSHIPLRTIAACLVLLMAAASMAIAGVPGVMNYQGRLTDNTPQQNPITGSLPMTFRIYGSTAGPDLLWQEIWPAVPAQNGIVNVNLGQLTAGGLPAAIFDGTERFLEIVVSGEILSPRQPLGSVSYAFKSDQAMQADSLGQVCATGEIIQFSGGAWTCAPLDICLPDSSSGCYSGPPGTAGVGACRSGFTTCNSGGTGFSSCQGQVTPVAEVCGNSVDDDCNGLAEETCTCPPSQLNCGGTCIDPGADSDNCGTCGNACSTGQFCQSGTCTPSTVFAGMVSNPDDASLPGPGIPSLWTYAGLSGVPAGDAMCQDIGGSHACTYTEVLQADAAGELDGLKSGTTFWLHRTTLTVDVAGAPSPPGEGGRCVDWTYPTGHIADGEFAASTSQGLRFTFDQDTTFTGVVADGHAGTSPNDGGPCGGVTRQVMCCK